jgi:hypothetical protein
VRGPQPPAALPLEIADGHHEMMPSQTALIVIRSLPGSQGKPGDIVPESAVRPAVTEHADALNWNPEQRHV